MTLFPSLCTGFIIHTRPVRLHSIIDLHCGLPAAAAVGGARFLPLTGKAGAAPPLAVVPSSLSPSASARPSALEKASLVLPAAPRSLRPSVRVRPRPPAPVCPSRPSVRPSILSIRSSSFGVPSQSPAAARTANSSPPSHKVSVIIMKPGSGLLSAEYVSAGVSLLPTQF